MSNKLITAALLAAAAPLGLAAAQDRDLDRTEPAGRVFALEVPAGGEAVSFLLTLQAGQALDVTAAQVDGSDPALTVRDASTGELIAENDDSAGTLAANVRLYSERRRRVRLEVRNASVDESDAAMRFDLVLRPSDYRPTVARDLALGETVSGTLARDGEQLFRFRAEQGQTWTFRLDSGDDSELDPALELFSGTIAAGEPLESDDDGGGELNARLRFTVAETGTYTLRAYGVGQSEGAWTLTSERAAAPAPAVLGEIGLDTPVEDSIDGEVRERFYRLSDAARAELAANPGPVTIEMNGLGEAEGALDPVVAAGFDTPLGFASAASDDDGGGGTNARLVVDAATLGPGWLDILRIRAGAFLETEGGYQLVVRRGVVEPVADEALDAAAEAAAEEAYAAVEEAAE